MKHSSFTLTGKSLLSAGSILCGILISSNVLAAVTITDASWNDRRNRLVVQGTGDRGDEVEVTNAVTGAEIDDDDVNRRGRWQIRERIRRDNRVPCSVRAVQEDDGSEDVAMVRNAPANCEGPVNPPDPNNAPVANPDDYLTDEDSVLNVAAPGVLANDTDADGDALSVSVSDAVSTLGAAVNVNANGSFGYDPTVSLALQALNTGEDVVDSFNYTVSDGNGGSDVGTVTVTVIGIDDQQPNNPPVCTIDTPPGDVTITVGGSVNYTATVSDADGDALSISWIFDGGAPASSNAEDPGAVTYNSAGAFTTTLSASDGLASCAPQTRIITVQAVQQQDCNIAVAPTALNFGGVNVGQSAAQSTTISNSGTAACNVNITATGSAEFAATPLNFSVAPGGAQAVDVSYSPVDAGADAGNLAIASNDPDTPVVNVTLSGNGIDAVACVPANADGISINSTSQDGCPDQVLPQAAQVANNSFSILAINDLGMHCGDLDTRISSILPPFQAMLAQVIQKGATPVLNPAGVDLFYSAASNPSDPILGLAAKDGLKADGSTYKTNFWNAVAAGSYDPFYPAFDPFNPAQALTPLSGPPFNIGPDVGLPVPNVEHLFLGPDGRIGSGDESLTAVTHAMPGIAIPYTANDAQLAQEHYIDKPFFVDFPFGYVAEQVNWYEGAGVPFAAFDDNGRENAYPLVRVEAKNASGATVSTVDTVLPISGEASCVNCHADPTDLTSVTGRASNSTAPTDALAAAGLPVVTSLSDPDPDMPPRVSLEYAGDINTLRLHDLTHGANYVTPVADGEVAADPCNIFANGGNGDASCLTNKALVQNQPVVCQVCHYTPALDLAHLGPLTGPPGTIANGRNHLHHRSNSNVMHSHHGSLGVFPDIPTVVQAANGAITNQTARLDALEQNCYQCHPGTNVQCLRGAMFNGGMLCSDCHGDMQQVGNDFTANVTVTNPGPNAWELGGNFYDPADPQPRVPWANEPGCGSCHTGDVNTSIAGAAGTVVNTADIDGNNDGIRLRQAFLSGDAKATPIVPVDKRFAEPEIPAQTAAGDNNNGAGNPQLYRVSTGHGGVMCEGCHGATHAEWPNANPNANDNVTANQLQGHVGTIVECDTCHTNINGLGNDGSLNSLQGPHGMHVVGNTQFADGGHADNLNRNACRACHGQNGEGSVLARTAADRNLPDAGFVARGTPITCDLCHGNEL